MDLENPIGLLRALAYVAWSDTRVSDVERAAFEQTMQNLGLSDELRKQGRAFLLQTPSLEDVVANLKSDGERTFAIRQVLMMAHSDDRYSAIEADKVERLAGALGIAPAKFAEIEATIEGYLPPIPPSIA